MPNFSWDCHYHWHNSFLFWGLCGASLIGQLQRSQETGSYGGGNRTQGLQWALFLCTLENAIHMPTEIGWCWTKKAYECPQWNILMEDDIACVCVWGGRPFHLAKKTISHLQGTAFNCYMARIQRASMCWDQKGLCLFTTYLELCPAQSLETK